MTAMTPPGAVLTAMSADIARTRPMPYKFGTATATTQARLGWMLNALADPNSLTSRAWTMLQNDSQTIDGVLEYFVPGRAAHGPADGFAWAQTNPLNLPPNTSGPPPTGTWEVPSTYLSADANATVITDIRYDAVCALNFALRYRITADETAAQAAIAQMEPWTAVTGFINDAHDNTRLGWANCFPMMLQACNLISASPYYTSEFADDMAALAVLSEGIPGSIGFQATNNQGAWGTALNLACAGFTSDHTLFDAAVAQWRLLLDYSIDTYGDFWQELYRQEGGLGDGISGLHYSCHALNAFTVGAEIARANGLWLYDYVTPQQNSTQHIVTTLNPDGTPVTTPVRHEFTITGLNTLRQTWERISAWLNTPSSFPYNSSGSDPVGEEVTGVNIGPMEILEALWPTAPGYALLANSRETYGGGVEDKRMPYTTFTYAGLPFRG